MEKEPSRYGKGAVTLWKRSRHPIQLPENQRVMRGENIGKQGKLGKQRKRVRACPMSFFFFFEAKRQRSKPKPVRFFAKIEQVLEKFCEQNFGFKTLKF